MTGPRGGVGGSAIRERPARTEIEFVSSGGSICWPTFESALRVMIEAGYRGDIYPSLVMWELAPTGVFASYPFPASLDRMRQSGF